MRNPKLSCSELIEFETERPQKGGNVIAWEESAAKPRGGSLLKEKHPKWVQRLEYQGNGGMCSDLNTHNINKHKVERATMCNKNYKSVKLGVLGEFKNGANFPKGSYGKGDKIVNVKDLFRGRYINENELDELLPKTLKNIESYQVEHGDILFTRSSLVRSGAGMCAMIYKPTTRIIFCGFIIRFRLNNKNIYPLYLLYLLRSPAYRQLFTGNQQTNITNINHDSLSSIPVSIPINKDGSFDYNKQIQIIRILDALDDKIALNRRINDKLEAMAKRLYDYWFVQFDFPDENGRPYKSSGGEMVWNETLKREIPAGWEVKPLKQFASYRTDTTKSENAYNYVSTDNMLPDKQGISDETIYPASGNIFQYKQNDILISNIRPYFKKIWFASHCGTCSTDIICIYSNQRQHNCYIYRTIWRDDFFDYVMQGAKGSKMPRGDKEHIMNYPICCHNYLTNVLLKIFNDKCMAIQEMLFRNNNATTRLAALRDRLLPLLMNGQVVVEGEERE